MTAGRETHPRRRLGSEERNANGLSSAGNSSISFGRFACHRAEPGPSQTRLRARTPERRRKANSCRGGELSPRGQVAGPSPRSIGIYYAYVLSGAIRSQVGDEPAKIYHAGEGFYEMPGSHHRISENASDKESASLLAVFVVDAKDDPLTTPDQAPRR
jgi:hypothetical protein